MSKEILMVAEAVSNEKGVDQEIIFGLLSKHWQRRPRSAMTKVQIFE